MLRHIQNVVDFYGFTFPSCVIFFFLTSIGIYFLFVRGLLASCIIKEKKMTKKERKLRQEEVWNRSKKETLKAFGKWILCKGYTDEQKGFFYGPFVVYNYIYIVVIMGYLILWLLAFAIDPLRFWCVVILIGKLNILDYPLFLVLAILFFSGKMKNSDS